MGWPRLVQNTAQITGLRLLLQTDQLAGLACGWLWRTCTSGSRTIPRSEEDSLLLKQLPMPMLAFHPHEGPAVNWDKMALFCLMVLGVHPESYNPVSLLAPEKNSTVWQQCVVEHTAYLPSQEAEERRY